MVEVMYGLKLPEKLSSDIPCVVSTKCLANKTSHISYERDKD